MALKPTVFKFNIALSDLNRNVYDSLSLTVAQHPSETVERMLARVLAFCMNAQERLLFCRGLSTSDEPDLWVRSLDDRIVLWIDVGEPAVERIKKASRISSAVKVYSFNAKAKSDVWWQKAREKFKLLNVSVYQFDWPSMQALAQRVQRTMTFSVMISEDSAYVSTEQGEYEIPWIMLQASSLQD